MPLTDDWRDVIFRQVCDWSLFVPESPPLPRPEDISITRELERLRREINRLPPPWFTKESDA